MTGLATGYYISGLMRYMATSETTPCMVCLCPQGISPAEQAAMVQQAMTSVVRLKQALERCGWGKLHASRTNNTQHENVA